MKFGLVEVVCIILLKARPQYCCLLHCLVTIQTIYETCLDMGLGFELKLMIMIIIFFSSDYLSYIHNFLSCSYYVFYNIIYSCCIIARVA